MFALRKLNTARNLNSLRMYFWRILIIPSVCSRNIMYLASGLPLSVWIRLKFTSVLVCCFLFYFFQALSPTWPGAAPDLLTRFIWWFIYIIWSLYFEVFIEYYCFMNFCFSAWYFFIEQNFFSLLYENSSFFAYCRCVNYKQKVD